MTYTKIAKPSAQTYTNIGKPTNGFMLPRGTATGLIAPPTYATTRTIGNSYTNIAKPTFPTTNHLDQVQSSNFDAVGFGGARNLAQSFQPSITAPIGDFQVLLTKFNNPTDNVKLEIWSDNNGLPGSLMVTSDTLIPGSSLIDDFFFNTTTCDFLFTNAPILQQDTTYWAVLSRTGFFDPANRYNINTSDDVSNPYTRGALFYSDDEGGNWANFSTDLGGGFFYDFVFNEYYQTSTSSYTNIPKPT